MDSHDTEFMLLKAMEEDEDIAAQDDLYTMQISTAALLMLAESGQQAWVDKQHDTRNYLCRAQLLPNPRVGTPWQALFRSRNDRAYITTMGFDVATFNYLVTSGFGIRWLSQPITRQQIVELVVK